MPARRAAALVLALVLALVARAATAAPPLINCPAPVETFETGQLQTLITASDPDGDPVTLRCVNPPVRALFDAPSGIFSWVPTYTQAGVYDIQFQAIAGGETTSCVFHVTVDNFDRLPVPSCPAAQTIGFTQILNLALTATDPDHDPLTWSSPKLPAGATLSPAGAFTWDTAKANIGSYNIEVDVFDGTLSVACNLAVNVVALAAPPIVSCPATVTVPELSTIQFTVGVVSPAGLGTSLTVQGMPLHATFDPTYDLFTWTPQPGQSGAYLVTFNAVDTANRRSSCTTQINVGSTNVSPPTFTVCPGPVSGRELLPILLQVTATDPQNLALAYGATGLPAGATYDPAGAFHWTPAVGQGGSYDVTFLVTNGAKSASCPVHFTIASLQPPAFTNCPGTRAGSELQALQFQLTATEPNGYLITLSATGLPAGSTFNIGTGAFAWTPVIGQAGGYDVTFKATSVAGTGTCPVHLTIAALSPGVPTIQCPGPFQVNEMDLLSLTITGTDPQGRALFFGLTNPPTGASLTPGGLFSWRPSLTQSGAYTLHFTVTNGFLGNACDVAGTVFNRPNTAPHLTCPSGFTTSVNRAITLNVPAVDAEGDPITYSARNLPAGATYAQGVFHWSPNDLGVGTYSPVFMAGDGELTDSCKVTLEAVPHPGQVQSLEPVLAHVRDVRPDQGGWVRVTLVSAPADLTAPPTVTGYGLWRRIEGPDAHALASPTALTAALGAVVSGAQALGLGFPPGTWESVGFTPALQQLDMNLLAPTRDDSSAAGSPYETFVATAHTAIPGNWFVSAPDSGYSVDDLPPRAPGALAASATPTGTRLTWTGSPDPDLDHYGILRGGGADFAPEGATVLGATLDSAFVDATPTPDAWYRVEAVDVHGNAALSAAVPGPGVPAWGAHGVALSAPRPNPTRGETAFDLVLAAAGEARLDVVSVRGAIVRTLVAASLPAGRTTLVWDGKDGAGRRAPSGLYHMRVRVAGVELARKILLLR